MRSTTSSSSGVAMTRFSFWSSFIQSTERRSPPQKEIGLNGDGCTRRLRHRGDQCLRVAQREMLKNAADVEFLLQQCRFQPVAGPALCTTARLGVVSPPMNRAMPTKPFIAGYGDLHRRPVPHHLEQKR